MIYLIYPERQVVSPEQIIVWAYDAYIDNEIPAEPEDLEHAIFMLQDAGKITVQSRSATQ